MFKPHEVKSYKLGKLELWLSMCPRQNIGFHYTWKHYQNHLISLNFYLGYGRKIDITIMS